MEFHKGKTVVKEDDWCSGELPGSKSTESWKGRTICRILAGRSRKTAQEQEQPEALHMERHRSEGESAPREAFHRERISSSFSS